MRKRALSALLALCLLLSMAVPALAAEENLTPCGDPSGLKWSDGEGNRGPGMAVWTTDGTFQSRLKFSLYKVGVDEPVDYTTHHYGAGHQNTRFVVDHFITYSAGNGDGEFESGDYYFTVQNLGDGITYSDSAVVSSKDMPNGVYHYVKPEAKLDTPEKGRWEWPAAVWDDEQESDERIYSYYIDYGFSETQTDDVNKIHTIGGSHSSQSGIEDSWLQNKLIGENGNGYYYFRVRPVSSNIEQIRNGDFSPWSTPYNLLDAANSVKDQLTALKDENDAGKIREQVQGMGQTALHNALRADLQNISSGVADALAALEAKVGGPAKTAVADEMKDAFDPSQISVVGAGLNNKTDDGEITLNVGKAKDENHIRDEMYDSTIAVDFSMDLENVRNTENLDVPVKITLPIPENINPDVLAILHYKSDGSYEEVFTNKFQKDGKWFVSFVLTSFSDFAMVQKKGQSDLTVTFDVNGGAELEQKSAKTNAEGKLTALPAPTRENYTFEGWYTAKEGGEKVTVETVFNQDTTIYAHWKAQGGSDGDGDHSGSSGSSGSSGGGSGAPSYSVAKPSGGNGAVSVDLSSASKGKQIVVSIAPNQGYAVDTVTVTGKDGEVTVTKSTDTRYTFVMPDSDVTIEVTYKKADVQEYPEYNLPAEGRFHDVTSGAWYYEAVQYVYRRGMMNGVSAYEFDPSGVTTRGMIVSLLYRLEGSPFAGAAEFSDVPAGQWYSGAVAWAAENGVVTGNADGTFNPNGPITREQIAAILYRYAQQKGYDVSKKADLSAFADGGSVSDYAKEAMAWANVAGLINGMDESVLAPGGSATRAQVAAILTRFLQSVEK